jgi:phage tail sheath protein FI
MQLSYPGVYIEEVPSGVRTIVGVATSIGAFVDYFAQGPMNKATRILSFADFERHFGGLDVRSEASYAIQQFFLNGGSEAYVVRVTSTTQTHRAKAAAISLQDSVGGNVVLTAIAKSEGAWGNGVRLDVDFATTDPANQFNLTVTNTQTTNGNLRVLATEVFRNLVIDSSKPNDAVAVVNAGSQLVTLTAPASPAKRPSMTGSLTGPNPDPTAPKQGDTMDVTLSGGPKKFTTAGLGAPQTTLAGLAAALQSLIQAADKSLANVNVSVLGSASSKSWLMAKAGTNNPSDVLTLGGTIATKLTFDVDKQNVQQYALGGTVAGAQALPGGEQKKGDDGTWDPANDSGGMAGGVIGDPDQKTGIYALKDVDLFNILCLPVTANLNDKNDASAGAVATAAEGLCMDRRAIYILDVPQGAGGRDTVDAIETWLDANATLRSKNAALYFPRVDIPDPLNAFRLRPVAPSGTIAGLYARIDGSRGVWKAPAGTEAGLMGVQSLEYRLTDGENGVLNPLAINCLRTFPVFGTVCWGARTLMGADQLADEYKYVPVRRLALFLEESLYRGTQWVVFEPNDEPLWAQIRLNIGAFMHNLFVQGAFQGQTPKDAYFVKCDKETTTQNDIDLGIVNIVVGFAPLKPAEFVIIKIQQMAGQIQT